MLNRLFSRGIKTRNKLLLAYLGLSIPLLIITSLAVLSIVKHSIEHNIESQLQNATDSIVSLVRGTASASIKNYLRAVAEKNLDIANHVYRTHLEGRMSREAAVGKIREILLSQVIGDTGYIYCINSQGIAVVHPRTGVEGWNWSTAAFVRQQIQQKTGYLEYDWKNPGETHTRPKALYMVYFEPLDWIISVSTYREEFASLINVEDLRDSVMAYKFGESGYSYIADDQGNTIIHPELPDYNIHQAGESEAKFFDDMVQRREGRIHYRWKNPSDPASREKLVIYNTIPEYHWIIASSTYTDEIYAPLYKIRRVIIAVTITLVGGYVFLALAISSHLSKPIHKLIEQFRAGAGGDLSVRFDDASTAETKELSHWFNTFMEQLNAYQESLKTEILERKHAQKDLEQSESKYRLLADNIKDVIWMLDMNMQYTYVSPASILLQGWAPEEMLKMTIEQTLTPGAFETAAQIIAKELETGEATGDFERSRVLELELNRKDGSTVWSEITATLIVGEDGKPDGILGVARDISDRRNAEAEKQELQEQLARSKKMEALGVLAGGVAHDLNNVLSGIASYPDLLLLDMPENSPLHAPIVTIKESGRKAASIVQDLLTLARRGVTITKIVNLNDVVRESLESPEHKKLASFHPDIDYEIRLERGLPNIVGSPLHLKKTLANLLSNASEAQPGGGHVLVSTDSRYLKQPVRGYDRVKRGEYAVLSVTDQGAGIEPEDIARIFEPFYTKKVMGRSGTGLGMAVVWGTVQDHKGYIDVISEIGKGTTFELYFPMTRKSVVQEDSGNAIEQCMGHQESVLVVDDVKEQREIAAQMLARLNYNVFTVSSGKKAVAFVRENPVDLVILDMIMDPGMDGLDTFRAIREHYPEMKAVIASGYAETDRVKDALEMGVGRYLKKPYSLEGLGNTVRDILDG